MVLYVMKWNIRPETLEEYLGWAQGAVQRTVAVPGVVEFRAYRPATGASQVVVTFEFADMPTWAAWHDHEDVQKVLGEVRTFTANLTTELWGPSPVVPEPVRPGG